MSTLNDTDLFVIERSGTQYQVRSDEMSTLNDTDLFVVERAGVQYKVEATDVNIESGPTGTITAPVEVLTPLNGAGLNANGTYQPLSTALTAVNAGGEATYATDTISNVAGNVLTFPTSNNFDKFEVGDVVQDGGWNQSQEWSNFWSGGQDDRAFDGDTNVGYNPDQNSTSVWNYPAGVAFTTLRIYYQVGSASGSWNDTTVNTYTFKPSSEGWVDLTSNVTSPLTLLSLTRGGEGGNTKISAVEIDGKLLVDSSVSNPDAVSITAIDAAGPTITTDGGSWLGADGTGDAGDGRYGPSQQWSSLVSAGSVVFNPTYGPTLAFNGKTDIVGTERFVIVNSDPYDITETTTISLPGLVAGQSVEFLGKGNAGSGEVRFNGTLVTDIFQSNVVAAEWNLLGTAIEGTNTITVGVASVNTDFYAIRVAGKLLIDASVPGGAGSTAISKTVTSDASLVFSSSSELANMVGPLLMVDENGSLKIPVTSEIASVAGNTLTFNSPNPDLQFFQPGDQIGTESGFAAVAYTGNGSITTGFSPDLVWIKSRTESQVHALFDSIRGASKLLSSNNTTAQVNDSSTLVSFDPAGFTVDGGYEVGKTGQDYVAWCWDAGDTTVTNNDGTIESQVRSNGNFSIVKYQGTGSNSTVGHGLNTAPSFYIVKNLVSDVPNWQVYHSALGATYYGGLNSTDAFTTAGGTSRWNDTPPTSSVFSVGTSNGVNANDLIAYAWAETPGVSSFGEYTGASNLKITTGFKPAFVLIKCTSENNFDWVIVDSARGNQGNGVSNKLYPSAAASENNNGRGTETKINFLDDGFQFTDEGAETNTSSRTYIYAAFSGSNPIEVVDVDVAANTMTVDAAGYEVGDTLSKPALVATADDVVSVSNNTLAVNGVLGTWYPGLYAEGAEVSEFPPSPSSIVFTSSNDGSTAFSGTDASLTSRIWTLEKGNSATGPWSEVGTYTDLAANASQNGSVPWDNPELEANKYYQVKVSYTSDNAETVTSTFNTFKTGDA